MDGQSLSITEQRINQLRELFPDVFSEGKIDFNRLKDTLGENILFPGEKYELSWPGKAEARREVQKQTTATLVPDHDGSINFDTAQNIFIEGENLEVLRVLQKSYFGKVKMIYIDPPYNTGSDSFVYPDDFAERQEEYLKRTGAKDEEGFLNKQDLWRKNNKENGHFHSTWLSMMYPRLYLARNLMREDGAIFVSIGDNEVSNLRLLMDEIFGEENFVAHLVWEKSKKGDAKLFAKTHEYVLVYTKFTSEKRTWRIKKEGVEDVLAFYEALVQQHGENHEMISDAMRKWYASMPKSDIRKSHSHYKFSDSRGLYFAADFAGPDDGRKSRPRYDIFHPTTKKPCKKPSTGWRWDEERTKKALEANPPLIHFGADETTIPCRKSYLYEIHSKPFSSVFYRDGRAGTLEVESLIGKGLFDFPKDVGIIKDFIKLITEEEDIILDFFAGSGTTGQAVLEQNAEDGGNRRFILVQMPELLEENKEAKKAGFRTISDMCKKRIQKVIERLQSETDKTPKSLKLFDGSKSNTNQAAGFQSYRLKYSNFKVWQNDFQSKESILNQLEIFQEPLSEYHGKYSELLTELILKSGFPLTVPVNERMIDDCQLFEVNNGQMWIVLDNISAAIFQAAAVARPSVFVTLNGLFTGENADQIMANAHLQLKEAGVEFKII